MILHRQTMFGSATKEPGWDSQTIDETSAHHAKLRELIAAGEAGFFPDWVPWTFTVQMREHCGLYRTSRGSDTVTFGAVAWNRRGSEEAWDVMLDFSNRVREAMSQGILANVRWKQSDAPPPVPWMVIMLLPTAINVLPIEDYARLVWHETELACAMIRHGTKPAED